VTAHDEDDVPAGAAGLGATTRGIWTRAQAVERLTRGRVDALVGDGYWQVVWPGVYADAGHVLDAEQRGFAAVVASGGAGQPFQRKKRQVVRAIACGRTAARIYELPLIDDDDPATGAQEALLDHVAVPWSAPALTSVQPEGRVRVLHRHRRAYARDEFVRLPSGLYVSSLLRTVVDCALLLSPEALVCLLDHALHREKVSAESLAQLVTQRAWHAGAVALRAAVRLADARAESPAETLARLLLLPVLPGLVPQKRLYDAGGRILARFDLGDDMLRLAVEADGVAGHAGWQMAAKDQRRDRVTDGFGWRTERCVWFELRCQQAALVRRVLAAADDQARRHRPAS
jgi:hypothetical protein